MRALLALVWAVLTVALIWLAVAVKAPAIEDDIRVRSTEAVKPLNANAAVDVDGRFVTVRGPEPDEASKARTLGGADDVWGALGPFDGLWTPTAASGATSPATPAAVPSGSGFFQAVRSPDGVIVATGEAPSEAAKTSLLAALKAGGAEVVDRVIIRPSGLPSAWADKLAAGAKALSGLGWGRLVLDGDRASLTGAQPADDAAVKALGSDWTVSLAPGGPVSGDAGLQGELDKAKADLAAATSSAGACEARASDAEGKLQACVAQANSTNTAKSATTAKADACHTATMRLLEGQTIEFATASAEITAGGRALLDRIAKEAVPCIKDQGLKVAIGGHTDAQGEDASNLTLSQRRADAVKQALVERGAPADFISAVGFGETQPIGDNATEQGRAANRRITFDWSVR